KLAGRSPESDGVQDIARRHVQWLCATMDPTRGYVIGLGEMYVSDPRFTAVYDQHGAGTAELVRDALRVYAERHLAD
ncbi:MAG: TipAS antibiotic-recognition domain-containing protein, partial [Pseudonocardia sp.]